MKIEIGMQVKGSLGNGIISNVITKSTGYVEVDYSGKIKKEMAFNLTDMNGVSLKSKSNSQYAGMSKGEKKRAKDRNAIPNSNSELKEKIATAIYYEHKF